MTLDGNNGALTLVIDQGTHATRALAFDDSGQLRASAYCPIALNRLSSDRVEQDGNEIIASLDQVIAEILADEQVRRLGVGQAGMATQRSTVAAWDKITGEPLAPILSWQDRRAAEWLAQFEPQAGAIKEATGLALTPHYGASKLRWMLENVPAVRRAFDQGRLAYGPFAAFLIFHLLRERPLVVDHTNAARTQLWNIESRDWDPQLLDLFGVPAGPLPACRPTCHNYGLLRAADIPLTLVIGDQNGAVFSLGQPEPGTAIINLGTGAFVLQSTGNERLRHPALLFGLASSDAHSGVYTLEGTVNGAGSALSWAESAWDIPNLIDGLATWLARPEAPPIFLNSISGLGSPWWHPGPEPTIVGEGEPWQWVVALAESILFLLQVNIDAMTAAGLPAKRIRVSGGISQLDALCSRLADLTGCPVYRPTEKEATARGAAWYAAGRPAQWAESQPGSLFQPRPNPALQARYRRFNQLMREAVYGTVGGC